MAFDRTLHNGKPMTLFRISLFYCYVYQWYIAVHYGIGPTGDIYIKVKVKVKVTLEQNAKAQKGGGGVEL